LTRKFTALKVLLTYVAKAKTTQNQQNRL